jgi:hypothetical protein
VAPCLLAGCQAGLLIITSADARPPVTPSGMYRKFTRLRYAAQTGLSHARPQHQSCLTRPSSIHNHDQPEQRPQGLRRLASQRFFKPWLDSYSEHSTPLANGQQLPPDVAPSTTQSTAHLAYSIGTTLMLQIEDSSATFKPASLN